MSLPIPVVPAASSAVAPHSRNHLVTRLVQEATRLQSTHGYKRGTLFSRTQRRADDL